jgi:hypothetical protein
MPRKKKVLPTPLDLIEPDASLDMCNPIPLSRRERG